jgi:hypothetical protein
MQTSTAGDLPEALSTARDVSPMSSSAPVDDSARGILARSCVAHRDQAWSPSSYLSFSIPRFDFVSARKDPYP